MITCSEESYQATLRRLEQIIEFLADGDYLKAMKLFERGSECAFCWDAGKREPVENTFYCAYCVWGNNGLNPPCYKLLPTSKNDWLPLALAAYGYLLTWEKEIR